MQNGLRHALPHQPPVSILWCPCWRSCRSCRKIERKRPAPGNFLPPQQSMPPEPPSLRPKPQQHPFIRHNDTHKRARLRFQQVCVNVVSCKIQYKYPTATHNGKIQRQDQTLTLFSKTQKGEIILKIQRGGCSAGSDGEILQRGPMVRFLSTTQWRGCLVISNDEVLQQGSTEISTVGSTIFGSSSRTV